MKRPRYDDRPVERQAINRLMRPQGARRNAPQKGAPIGPRPKNGDGDSKRD